MGEIIPFHHEEILPNDLIRMRVDGLIRFSPMVAPLMHRVKATFYWIFVPTRVLDDTFPDFITGGPDGNDTTTLPTISTGASATKGTVYDYLDVPIVNNLSFLAHAVYGYNNIYNELFRDPDLEQTEVANTSVAIQFVMWEKDYFTTCRPSDTKGTEVTISLLGNADVVGDGSKPTFTSGTDSRFLYGNSGNNTAWWNSNPTATGTMDWDDPHLQADLTSVSGIPLSDLKEAWAFNEYQENRYKYGSRFTEYLRFLGGNSGDARLQRPELISVSSVDINISEVLSTAYDATNSEPVGSLKGHGVAGVRGRTATKYFGEHGQLYGIMHIRPEAVYTSGIPRKFNRVDKENFYQPEFARLNFQAVKNKEIYAQGTGGGSDDDNTFGYTSMYREYTEGKNHVSGDFRDTLDTWGLWRQFSSLPVLNKATISTENTIRDSDVFASVTNDTIYCITNSSLKARRIVLPREPMTFIRY
jgi:hypothetical protein